MAGSEMIEALLADTDATPRRLVALGFADWSDSPDAGAESGKRAETPPECPFYPCMSKRAVRWTIAS